MTQLATGGSGGCLCGAVRYRFSSPPIAVFHCHCAMCRRAAGAPLVTWLTVRTEDFGWAAAAPRDYRSSAIARRFFCAECGTPLAFQADADPNQLDLTLATLDDPAALAPTHHVWVASRLPWLEIDDGLPRHPGEAPE